MLICQKFTYISNPKTGSSSVFNALKDSCYAVEAGPRHIPPHQIAWNSPRQFVANVRHPADRLVSAWAYTSRQKTSFQDWLRGEPYLFGGADIKRTSQGYWVPEGVKTVLRFENLADDWAALLERFGLPFVNLPHDRPSVRPDWRHVVTEDDMTIIRDRFLYDFQTWGYA